MASPGRDSRRAAAVLFAQNQMRVALAALQGDPYGHLAESAAGERIGASQRLRSQQHVHAEGTPLPDQTVEQQRRRL